MQPLLNVLIRTSNRPELFGRCIDSIKKQTYKKVRIIVGTDSDQTYSKEFDTYRVVKSDSKFFYNEYCNELKQLVTEGYFMFVDDDDFLDNPFVFESIVPHLKEDKAVICQYRRKGRPKPPNVQMDDKIIARGWIGLPCIILHHSKKNLAEIKGDHDYDDYLFIKEVVGKIDPVFVKQIVVGTDRRSWGK